MNWRLKARVGPQGEALARSPQVRAEFGKGAAGIYSYVPGDLFSVNGSSPLRVEIRLAKRLPKNFEPHASALLELVSGHRVQSRSLDVQSDTGIS